MSFTRIRDRDMTQESTILVQEEFIKRIDSIDSGLKTLREDFQALASNVDANFDDVKLHLADQDNRILELTDPVRKTLEEVRSIGVAIEVYSISQPLLENPVSVLS